MSGIYRVDYGRLAPLKLCGLCGRWGTRNYREADSSDRPGYSPVRDGHWVCVNDRACKRRAAIEARPNPILTYTDPAGGPDWEPRRDEA